MEIIVSEDDSPERLELMRAARGRQQIEASMAQGAGWVFMSGIIFRKGNTEKWN